MPYTVSGSITVYCGVNFNSVWGPNAPMDEGQKIFSIFPSRARFKTVSSVSMFNRQASIGRVSPTAESMAER